MINYKMLHVGKEWMMVEEIAHSDIQKEIDDIVILSSLSGYAIEISFRQYETLDTDVIYLYVRINGQRVFGLTFDIDAERVLKSVTLVSIPHGFRRRIKKGIIVTLQEFKSKLMED